ncbi:winged helix-turn-helix transcriptional regulator [Chengkuizengella axinellae]|uniref:Helix-turn-helix domain-containing protein n=1 Tax=Chengkuizengella axinellae TaxID=3064388 RepID=A0ABT9J4J6_9BACL|nr:helix-turn-helix domain-containing protein [Chengkuizengella sp. 2205SS18-9]MDP5276551.1 helix-turn-helix domain-containing protein [Chengkuizengella sp. 2205SS18-9]
MKSSNNNDARYFSIDKYSCSVEATIDVIGGKWKSVIIYYLLDGKKRFNELKRLNNGITQRMLTLQLRELEADGIIHREVYREVPPKVEYSLTEFGQELRPLILMLKSWGMNNTEKVIENRSKYTNKLK